MSRTYDNWERLVAAVIKKQQLLTLFHNHSRNSSDLSEASSDFSLSTIDNIKSLDSWVPTSSSPCDHEQIQHQLLITADHRSPRLVLVSYFESIIFELEDLLFASFELLGKENSGLSYAAKLVNGVKVVAKRLNKVNISEQHIGRETEVARKDQHENVASMRAYYFSKGEKVLIRDHYSSGSVSELLHGKPVKYRDDVDWKLRLRIAIGVARGISHIHKQNGGNWVHGNIKASNIFLNSQRCGHVSNIGLVRMIPTTFPQSSRCYAPEAESNQDVSQASDVYSFGVLLLELLTRRSPDPTHGDEAVNLVKLVSRKKWITEFFDEDLLVNPSIRVQIERMLEIGIICVAKSAKKRPKMPAVVKMIEAIGMMGIGGEISVLDREDMLFSTDKVLGNGTLSTSYKVILEDGNVISVKRLMDVNVSNQEFQQYVEVFGRMGHENVAEVKAYYYSTNEKLLVYDFHNEGSLSARLHIGNRDPGKSPLDWNRRIDIAVGAAKGIAHMHMLNARKLVHGNITASNILLNENLDAIVCDAGLGRLVSSTKSFVTRNPGYCAPEVTDYMEVTQASDVYSFGVVLLQILTAKPPQTTYKGEVISLVRRTTAVPRDKWASQVIDQELLRWHSDVDEEIKKVMKIAMHCVDSVPERRPKMADVVELLEQLEGHERDKISSFEDL